MLGFSLLYQLAFVLETEAELLQGQLFVWIVVLLLLTLVHYGSFGLFVVLVQPLFYKDHCHSVTSFFFLYYDTKVWDFSYRFERMVLG